jgi:hypothetical protein
MDSLDDNEDELEEEAQEEVDKVLWQITDGKLGVANGKVGALPVSHQCLPVKSYLKANGMTTFSKLQVRLQKSYRRTKKWSEPLLGCSAAERLNYFLSASVMAQLCAVETA